MANDERQALVEFWFGVTGEPGCDEPRLIWFKSDADFDAALGDRFGALHERAAAGALDDWAEMAEGALALVLLLDQLPRNLHRGTPRAFGCDSLARAVARRALARGFDGALVLVRRVFLYLPFEHSEDLADQDEALRLFTAMQDGDKHANWLRAARQHHAIVARFGRFPHRNLALGRASSPEEEEFLRGPGSSF